MTACTQRRHLQYATTQLFDLVADVEAYPEFLPWVKEVDVHQRKDHSIFVSMTVADGPLRRRFSTMAVLDRPHRIEISSCDPIFDRFEQRWTFEPATNGGTNVEYHVDFKFRSRVLQMLMGKSFASRAIATMSAFERQAHRLYGGQS
jgi:coenzyme Q-binding protein COQ10